MKATIIACFIAVWTVVMASAQTPSPTNQIVLPQFTPDPLERMNRAIWTVNKVVGNNVAVPIGRAYRFVIRKPLRGGINNFADNLIYPKRLLNNMLVGKWRGAWQETERFLVNSTVGIGGLLNIGDRWKMPKSDADFGKTFAHYGYGTGAYLVLPVYGPSNVRDGLGQIGDSAANPLNYFPPYAFATYGLNFNEVSDQLEGLKRFTESQIDSYETVKQAATFLRQNRVIDYQVTGVQDPASLETLQIVFMDLKDPAFPGRRHEGSVRLPTTGDKLEYSFWLQKQKAPCVYVLPGLGAHRLANPAIALAEVAYRQGFNAVVISSAFNCEFIGAASTIGLPGHTPTDSRDVLTALSEIDRRLRRKHARTMGESALMGYSMGAFHTLSIAAVQAEKPDPSMIRFDRFLAINPPVDLLYGAKQLDAYYNAPLQWDASERTARIENTFLKVTSLFRERELRPSTTLSPSAMPFSSVESQFIIGYVFRNSLRETIFDSQIENDLGIIKTPLTRYRRTDAYREIMNYSFEDYFTVFAGPRFKDFGVISDSAALAKVNTLRSHESALRGNDKIRLVLNQNDFLLSDDDLRWLRTTIGPGRTTLFERGGHLGNLGEGRVQKAIATGLANLKRLSSGEDSK